MAVTQPSAITSVEENARVPASLAESDAAALMTEMESLEGKVLEPEFIDEQVPDTVCWYVAYST